MVSFIAPATRKSGSQPIPAHLLNGNKLKADVKAGTVITYDMVEKPENSVLWDLRQKLEEYFFS
jgi:predicted homoserine dehydrogenase-like protein